MPKRINREDLRRGLGNVTQSDWLKAGRRLGLIVRADYGRGSHAIIRDPRYPDPADMRGHITAVQLRLHRQMNQVIFEELIDFGIAEDDVWKALKML